MEDGLMTYVRDFILKDTNVDEIMGYLEKREIIPDDTLYVFYSRTMKVVQDKAYSAVTERAKDFCSYMSYLWSSRAFFDYESPLLIFQLGELHTCSRMLEKLFSDKREEDDIEINSKWLSNKGLFFQLISDNPGIKHGELAASMQISKSSLSQFVSKIKGYGYHYERTAGREKYYYLTNFGHRLLDRIMEEKKKNVDLEHRKTTIGVERDKKCNIALYDFNVVDYFNEIAEKLPMCSLNGKYSRTLKEFAKDKKEAVNISINVPDEYSDYDRIHKYMTKFNQVLSELDNGFEDVFFDDDGKSNENVNSDLSNKKLCYNR